VELSEIQDEVKLKVGRNLLLLQQVERQMKFIVTRSALSGNSSDLRSNHEQKKESVGKRSLGMVARDFIDGPPSQVSPKEVSEVHLSYSFKYDLSDDEIDRLELLVMERNKLVHHFLDDVDFDSASSMKDSISRLDESRKTILAASSHLGNLIHSLVEAREAAVDAVTEHFKTVQLTGADALEQN